MKDLDRYLGETYTNSFQPVIINETPYTLPDPYIPTIIPDTGFECPKTDVEMNYLENKSTGKAIHQKLRKKDIYKTDMHNIYNLIVGQTNEQLQEKEASDATLHEIKTGKYPIGYPMILRKIYFSNKYEKHPIR